MSIYHILTGRINKLALVEILALSGSTNDEVKLDSDNHIISIKKDFDYTRLGMSNRVFRQDGNNTDWLKELSDLVRQKRLSSGKDKIIIGINNYSGISKNKLVSLIKNNLDKKVRLILPQDKFLNYSQSYQYSQKNSYIEILITNSGLAQMVWVNNLSAQVKRDMKKPVRDMNIGIMPINLARLLINIGVGVNNNQPLWDPFCGTGTILAEGLYMGLQVYGSDISPKSIKATNANIDWLLKENNISSDLLLSIDLVDAKKANVKANTIISEGYLGEIYYKAPTTRELRSNIAKLCDLYLRALENFYQQSNISKVIITLPCFQLPQEKEIILLPIIDQIKAIGYNTKYREFYPLIFIRPDQIVGRQILALER